MTISEISNIRLISQKIASAEFKTAKEIISWMGALQAQDYSMAKWAIGVRLSDLADKEIESSIDKGEILRIHVLRPTWHFISADDIYWMLNLAAPKIKSSLKSRHKELELTETSFDEFLISYKDRSSSLSTVSNKKTVSDNGIFYPIIVINGQVNGLWKRTIKKNKVTIEMDFFQPVNKSIRGLIEKKAFIYGQFLNKETEVIYKAGPF